MVRAGKQKIFAALFAVSGGAAGLLNGWIGGGGGLLAVPALKTFAFRSPKEAHATSLLLLLPVTLLSGILYAISSPPNFSLLVPCTLGVTIGGVCGAKCLKKVSSPALTIGFAALTLLAGIKYIL